MAPTTRLANSQSLPDSGTLNPSPYHSKSNGKAESAVKIAKAIVKKAAKEGKDMWQALLEWRSTPTPGMDSSPAQRLMSRRTRSFLPCKDTHYRPHVVDAVTETVIHKRQSAKMYHDRSARALPDLVVGQPIRAKSRPKVPDSRWIPGVVTAEVAPRSYLVEVDGRVYRRNRVHLRDTLRQTPDTPVTRDVDDVTPPVRVTSPVRARDNLTAPPMQSPQDQPHCAVTRAGRVSRPPKRLIEST
jgi:hypothetical protein